MNRKAASRKWKILIALKQQPMTSRDLMPVLGLGRHSVARYLRFLRADKLIHIARHIRTQGEPIPVYALGNRPDAEYVPLKPPASKQARRKDDMMRRVLEAIMSSPMTARQVGELLYICQNRAGVYISMLRRQQPGTIYIKGWQPAPGRGQPAPIYAIGDQKDVPMRSKTPAQKYREAVRDKDKKEHRLRMERKRYHARKKQQQPANWASALGI